MKTENVERLLAQNSRKATADVGQNIKTCVQFTGCWMVLRYQFIILSQHKIRSAVLLSCAIRRDVYGCLVSRSGAVDAVSKRLVRITHVSGREEILLSHLSLHACSLP